MDPTEHPTEPTESTRPPFWTSNFDSNISFCYLIELYFVDARVIATSLTCIRREVYSEVLFPRSPSADIAPYRLAGDTRSLHRCMAGRFQPCSSGFRY